MTDILNDNSIFDDRKVKFDIHTYNPFANSTVQRQDKNTATGFIHIYAVRKLSIYIYWGKTDEEQRSSECYRGIGK